VSGSTDSGRAARERDEALTNVRAIPQRRADAFITERAMVRVARKNGITWDEIGAILALPADLAADLYGEPTRD
jgi:hypothetical protein